ncbi:hypothetical protein BDZ91DRAFT_740598 [Kalaharituber pfeilii]|nr:hypothetical protein BDZ91DRAFT_740598 [Kalaharituber pfeilii]
MATKSKTHNPTNFKFLHTDFFKIILTDVVAQSNLEDKTSPTNTNRATLPDTEASIPDEAVFYVHRSLLASLSAELDKHVNNDMKEGIQGVMELSEVDEATMTAFLQWAYNLKDDYTIENPKATSALLGHTKIYVLADRFNTVALKDLAYNKITALLVDLGMVAAANDVEAVMTAVSYAFGNLPFSTSSTRISAPTEKLLNYFAQYTSWALDVFRTNLEFCSLLENSPDFARALVTNSRSAATPPWSSIITDTGIGSTATLDVCAIPDKDNILCRQCGSCGYIGAAVVHCPQCNRYDCETGDSIQSNGNAIAILGAKRLSGTKTSYTYQCKWCAVSTTFPSGSYTHSSRLYCRKCLTSSLTI